MQHVNEKKEMVVRQDKSVRLYSEKGGDGKVGNSSSFPRVFIQIIDWFFLFVFWPQESEPERLTPSEYFTRVLRHSSDFYNTQSPVWFYKQWWSIVSFFLLGVDVVRIPPFIVIS